MTVERFPVEESHILTFARAIGDESPIYVDPTSREAASFGGVIAPPTFTVAAMQFDPDFVLRPKLGEPWFGSPIPDAPGAVDDSGRLHGEQHFEYHRPIVAGEVLTTIERAGDTWEKPSKHGGTLRFEELLTEFIDVDTGETVVTSRSVSVYPIAATGTTD